VSDLVTPQPAQDSVLTEGQESGETLPPVTTPGLPTPTLAGTPITATPRPTTAVATFPIELLNPNLDGGFYFQDGIRELGVAKNWTLFWEEALKRPETYVMPDQKPDDLDLKGFNQYLYLILQNPDRGYDAGPDYRSVQKGFTYAAPGRFGLYQTVRTYPGAQCILSAEYTTIVARDPVHWAATDMLDFREYDGVTYYPYYSLPNPVVSRGFVSVDLEGGTNYRDVDAKREMDNILWLGDPEKAALWNVTELGRPEVEFVTTGDRITVFVGIEFIYGNNPNLADRHQHVEINDWLLFRTRLDCQPPG
jgi:hypothetical protein